MKKISRQIEEIEFAYTIENGEYILYCKQTSQIWGFTSRANCVARAKLAAMQNIHRMSNRAAEDLLDRPTTSMTGVAHLPKGGTYGLNKSKRRFKIQLQVYVEPDTYIWHMYVNTRNTTISGLGPWESIRKAFDSMIEAELDKKILSVKAFNATASKKRTAKRIMPTRTHSSLNKARQHRPRV